MLETILISVFCGFFGGLIVVFLAYAGIIKELLTTRKVVKTVMNHIYGEKGVTARKQAKDDTEQAITEGLALVSQGKDLKEVGGYLLAKYPGAISPIMKQLDIKL